MDDKNEVKVALPQCFFFSIINDSAIYFACHCWCQQFDKDSFDWINRHLLWQKADIQCTLQASDDSQHISRSLGNWFAYFSFVRTSGNAAMALLSRIHKHQNQSMAYKMNKWVQTMEGWTKRSTFNTITQYPAIIWF